MVARIRLRRRTTTFLILFALYIPAQAAVGNWLPKGHYLSFSRERNLQAEMLGVIEQPSAAQSGYHLGIAEDLDDALRTQGVRGLYMAFDWRTIEVADGVYNWTPIDENMDVARLYGLKLVVKISDRSFNGTNVLPEYFPSQYVLASSGGGKEGYVAKRWDPWVYNRTIRLYKAIAQRYASHAGFGGIATTETATGNASSGGDYSLPKYLTALTEIVTGTQGALTQGRLFFYLNFLSGGDSSDMNRDARVNLLRDLPHGALVVGAPDITPDVQGMPRSVTAYRIHARKTMPSLSQFCHAQHADQGQGGVNVKSNEHRQQYFQEVANTRDREQQSWFEGEPAVFELDDLRDSQGRKVDLHPGSVLGELWTPAELFSYARRNFGCDYFLWHYREHPGPNEFGWPDVKPVIVSNQCFYHPDGCEGAEHAAMPNAPSLF